MSCIDLSYSITSLYMCWLIGPSSRVTISTRYQKLLTYASYMNSYITNIYITYCFIYCTHLGMGAHYWKGPHIFRWRFVVVELSQALQCHFLNLTICRYSCNQWCISIFVAIKPDASHNILYRHASVLVLPFQHFSCQHCFRRLVSSSCSDWRHVISCTASGMVVLPYVDSRGLPYLLGTNVLLCSGKHCDCYWSRNGISQCFGC
jgi:hypothetical protein